MTPRDAIRLRCWPTESPQGFVKHPPSRGQYFTLHTDHVLSYPYISYLRWIRHRSFVSGVYVWYISDSRSYGRIFIGRQLPVVRWNMATTNYVYIFVLRPDRFCNSMSSGWLRTDGCVSATGDTRGNWCYIKQFGDLFCPPV